MTSILFVRTDRVYLPEVQAYKAWLARHRPGVEVFESTQDTGGRSVGDFDVVWHFMGLDAAGRGRFVVHEYNSLSTAPFARVKNMVKRAVNARPDRRVFLSPAVRDGFGFRDGVGAALRDMGVDPQFFAAAGENTKEWDFILAGGLNRGPAIARALDLFTGPLREMSVVLVGDAPDNLAARYRGRENIVFHGRAAYADVPGLMARARYGLNIMPDRYPFNVQTATKVLEYCAAGLPVVSTDYRWARRFERETGARFFKLEAGFSGVSPAAIRGFDFAVPPMAHLSWERVIGDSGIFSFLG